jgi:eukaryotic-like serine/threonine-protein kinase
MEPERWAVIESLYHAALERDPDERSLWLRQACGEDALLLGEVESLLACAGANLSNPEARPELENLWDHIAGDPDAGAAGLNPAVAAGAEAASAPAEVPTALPSTIGRYRILRLLGEGGMGVVYEAEQEQPRRTVALKVIKSGLGDPKLVRRFEQESLALGRLQHPGIAQIYEAGTAETGFGPQPYFAMEFIRGESLLQYAKAHQLSIRQRLELMAKICEAVHHAHQRGIIHRDLKPGNILVDETGQPKILDFGVARAINSDAHVSRQTDLGQLVGTLAYMSPEQVLADPLELDTRSDVYALGVVLYELLAGRLPYTVSPRLHEAVQTIREEEPRPLSTFNSAYRGEIETIVCKALEKDKTRRYASTAELGADIRRYLQDEPIMARPASATYPRIN